MTMTFPHRPLYADPYTAIDEAATLSDQHAAPVAVWARDGWYTASEFPPDDDVFNVSPEELGWTWHALLEPEDGCA